jgi:LAS superfamily LD-carboxypeptidase LdcB
MVNNALLTGKTDSHIHWLSETLGIHKNMFTDFNAMTVAAKSAGFNLTIASGFRNFDRQLSIWNRKASGELPVYDIEQKHVDIHQLSAENKILAIALYSALPGASRHHWGTDIDVYAPNLLREGQSLQLQLWEYENEGPFHLLSLWLATHAKQFGFFLPYRKYSNGVAPEPWHLSYLPLAKQCQQALTIDILREAIIHSSILDKQIVLKLLPQLYQQYIMNINGEDYG